ncbi:sulfatase modifying factor 1 (C-alpha-formyglycine- generating enzyme 1) [Phyllobacterium phragmitis]|uniref:Sulfatase modifying factor 1 (C-alpha-formyglycine-generating enzyme 1) n=1 Tax=Phyllobacterium phragmitis TaxID=2670329 RepID=A0A2S9IWC4_9HYPH|nr:formylglycine-generating enzyme family protein [Phyllobacterium phragmitis]PRD44818.1 sulfatase modifying factor 1 (C-alpha-formyglycine- generating enzyme 1) [Phyllobacterium phragmitis]
MTCCPSRTESSLPAAAASTFEPGYRTPQTIPGRFVSIDGGKSFVGTNNPQHRSDGEAPRRKSTLTPYRIDPYTVTNRWFREFVSATRYTTDAERYGWSLVFQAFVPQGRQYQRVVDTPWWLRVDGADWAHPFGPSSSIKGIEDHPVTHVSWNDANAFSVWAGVRLPTEAEWEHAARGGLMDATFPWGEEEPSDTVPLCNIWQGTFPHHNTQADGYLGTAPVHAFQPNGYGLYNMAGNVWEWCSDPFRIHSVGPNAKKQNAAAANSGIRILKGGSFLCHRSYCYRYRIAARTGVSPDSSTSHVGFRVVN